MTQEETKQREGTISAELWAHIEEILAEKKRVRRRGSGRPAADGKAVLEGILWVLHSGARWKDMPRDGRYPAYQTVHRTFQKWVELGIFQEIMARLVRAWERENKQKLLHEGSMDASFIAAKKGAIKSVGQNAEREVSCWSSLMPKVALSPLLWQALSHTKSTWFQKPLRPVSRKIFRA
jgi:transposase